MRKLLFFFSIILLSVVYDDYSDTEYSNESRRSADRPSQIISGGSSKNKGLRAIYLKKAFFKSGSGFERQQYAGAFYAEASLKNREALRHSQVINLYTKEEYNSDNPQAVSPRGPPAPVYI